MRKAQYAFRRHVRKPSNPTARIHREPCFFCVEDARLRSKETGEPLDLSRCLIGEGHHVDYARPFLVAWLCESHHRQVDHGALKLPKRALWDYESVVACIWKPGNRGANNGHSHAKVKERAASVVPF